MIPDAIRQQLRQKLGAQIDNIHSVSGGSINRAAKLTLSDGTSCFLKWNTSADPDMFVKEKRGLKLLAGADTKLRIPSTLAVGKTTDDTGYLAMEYISEGRSIDHSAEDFGRQLAALHKHQAKKYGLNHNNYIGKLPQSNQQHKEWIDFFINERMEPQLRMASDAHKLGSETIAHFKAMYKQLPDIFPEEPASLLHGDLWGGNYFYDNQGRATIFDPAVYYGHREIELAFTHLFGGFSRCFYRAYKEAYPLQSGLKHRKDIYNLYPLLVHTNLFGGSYARQVQTIVSRF
ncbi:fructosamine kinase family protein [Aliifodinibius salicampi]|uniref:Fructosamine kinase family protein n=1 Tax=Fodinibius salicampi TaxID=1920655 RepID=A0ABT3Q074_9BACT|nr:fructosamine kinase family protein [Fodinibius salicampi]MCW9713522.1 fructosamine kinase family protein [Fodinibius salicampi]